MLMRLHRIATLACLLSLVSPTSDASAQLVELFIQPATGAVDGDRWELSMDASIDVHRIAIGFLKPASVAPGDFRISGCDAVSCLASTDLGPTVDPVTSFTLGPAYPGHDPDALYVALEGNISPFNTLNTAGSPVFLAIIEYDPSVPVVQRIAPPATLAVPPELGDFEDSFGGVISPGDISYTILFGGGGDSDGDGWDDDLDNCVFAYNPGQEDSGSLLSIFPDAIGDACQCGDLSGDGVIDGTDLDRARKTLVGASTPPVSIELCNIVGTGDAGATDCGVDDLFALVRALQGLPPGISQVCTPAVAP
jgi:hypothetical protein